MIKIYEYITLKHEQKIMQFQLPTVTNCEKFYFQTPVFLFGMQRILYRKKNSNILLYFYYQLIASNKSHHDLIAPQKTQYLSIQFRMVVLLCNFFPCQTKNLGYQYENCYNKIKDILPNVLKPLIFKTKQSLIILNIKRNSFRRP